MKPPSEPPFFHNFHYYCDLPSMTIPQVGPQPYADEQVILANPGMANPHGSQSRGAPTMVPPVVRPPSTREPTSGYSGATVVPESSFSPDPLLTIHCSQASDEMFRSTPFDADSRNTPLPILPASGFQYSAWDGQRGGPQPNDHSLSFSPPANQGRNNNQPTAYQYTQCVPTMFATVPMRDIDENWMDTTIYDAKATEKSSGTPDTTCTTSGPIRSKPPRFLARHRSEQTVLDRPGKKPPAKYEADPMELSDPVPTRGIEGKLKGGMSGR